MTNMKKALLGMVTLFSPVFLAACYGPPGRYMALTGKVVSGDGGTGISGIKVSCVHSGQARSQLATDSEGNFTFPADQVCEELVFEDVDLDLNGGNFAATSLPPNYQEEMLVRLEKAGE